MTSDGFGPGHKTAQRGISRWASDRALSVAATSALLLPLTLAPLTLWAQAPDPGETRRQLEASRYQRDETQKRLEETQKRQTELKSEVAQLNEAQSKLNAQLIDSAQKIQTGEAQVSAIEARIAVLEVQEHDIRLSLLKSHGSLSGLLAAMQRIGRNPPPVMVTRSEDALAMVRSAMLLSKAFPRMSSEALTLSTQLNDLVSVLEGNRVEKQRLKDETARLADNRFQLTALIETQKRTIAERQDELAQVRKAAADLSKNVTDLNDLLTRLDKAVSDKTRLGDYERRLAAAQAAPPTPPTAGPTATVTPPNPADPAAPASKRVASAPKAPQDSRPAVTLQPGEIMAMAAPSRIEPAIPFEDARGLLRLPAQGTIIQRFGDQTQSGKSDGIVIETRPGAQVVSPNDGWIVYAGEFRSYGQILIINAGGGYHILLAGLSQINVQVGQFLLAGMPVGVMTTTPKVAGVKSASTKSQDNAPVLYIEFRKNQRPIDPGPWWAENRKVAG